jgi:hypothetical protein
VETTFRYGMGSEAGEHAVRALVLRWRGSDIATLTDALPGALALIASMHPEVRGELVRHTVADALGLRG